MTSPRRGRREILVVCGEPSGDQMGAEALSCLAVRSFGVGGPELRRLGLESLVPMEGLSAMGASAARKLLTLGIAWRSVKRAVVERQPRAALLVGFSDFNARLGRWLRQRGTRVVWYAPPQFWAWRPGRGPRLVESADHFALLLPFEEALWRGLGATASYVGHPALGWCDSQQERVGDQVALLPGSRDHEVRRLWPILLSSARLLHLTAPDRRFEVALSHGLSPSLRAQVARSARRAGLSLSQDPKAVLARSDVAVCCSGTATLQSALSGCPPIIVYPTSRIAELALRRLVSVEHVGLPNLVLDRRAFPELVGHGVTPAEVARLTIEVTTALSSHHDACNELLTRLTANLEQAPGRHVATLVEQYL